MFGVSLCAAPYAVAGQGLPPLATGSRPLAPYLPWTWTWQDKVNPALSGFRWTLLVRMRKTGSTEFKWMPVPAKADDGTELVRVYDVPADVNDDLARLEGGGSAGTVHETWWEPELARLTVQVNSGVPAWKRDGMALPYAHSSQLAGFYTNGSPSEISVDGANHETHPDLLGQRMLRWSTENLPHNFFNRLAAVIAVPAFASLRAAMAAKYTDYAVEDDSVRFAALPLWVSSDYPPEAPFDQGYSSDDYLVADQTRIPVDGTGQYLRRFYCNAVSKPADGTSGDAHSATDAQGALDVDDRPWRREAEAKLGRCVDLPSLLLDWVSAQLTLSPAPALVDADFANGTLAGWTAGLSADLFQARRPLAAAPADADGWLGQLAGVLNPHGDTSQIATADRHLFESIQAVRDLIPGVPGLAADSVLKDADKAALCVRCYDTLAEFVHQLRVSATFARLRAGVETTPDATEADKAKEIDWVADAFQCSLDQPLNGSTIRGRVLPRLKITGKVRDVAELCIALGDYLANRLSPGSHALPRLQPADASLLTAFNSYLNDSAGAAGRFADLIYGDPAQPAAHLSGFSLTARLGGGAEYLDPAKDGDTTDRLDEHAGALVLGRLRKTGGTPGEWMSLNTGWLRVGVALDDTHPGVFTKYQAGQVSDPPLRGNYTHMVADPRMRGGKPVGRRSVAADYDNRPLVAISPKDELVLADRSRLASKDADAAKAIQPRVDYVWANGPRKLPGLRYHGPGVTYQFSWISLSNSCCLPQGLWKTHPALLDLTADALDGKPGVLVSGEVPYLRQVAITAPHVEVAFKSTLTSGVTVKTPLILAADDPAGRAFNLVPRAWPALPSGVFPLSGEIPPADAPADTPLLLLFPAQSVEKRLVRPHTLVRQLTLSIGKPRTGDDNWDRWVSADPDNTRPARRRVAIEAHRERDRIVLGADPIAPFFDPQDPKNSEPRWQPDDPALARSNAFLVVFRRLYPNASPVPAKAFVLQWVKTANTQFYQEAADYFTDPFRLTLIHDSSLAPADFVVPGDNASGAQTFKVAAGTLVEIGFYSLLLPAERDRFAPGLVDPPQGPNSLGQSVASLLGGTVPADWNRVGGAAVADVLAVSPAFLRVEAARLQLPAPREAYDALSVGAQGAVVTLSVSKSRDPDTFNLVHEVVAQEQIWRWNGKPSMPEDFVDPATGASSVRLPRPDPAPAGEHFGWDGIAFHGREDQEHLAVSGLLPLLPQRIADTAVPGDLIFSDDKSSDARALYFRFSALLRSRYAGAWPGGVVQAGEKLQDEVATLWKRHVLPHRLTAPLKKPAIVMILPLLATRGGVPDGGDSAGVLAIARETCFEQAGLAEKIECEVVEAPVYVSDGSIHAGDEKFLQAGYDPTLVAVAMSPHTAAVKPPVHISGPVGLTFDQGSRDPLIVNSLFFIDVDRKVLSTLGPRDAFTNDPPSPLDLARPPAAHLFCQLRFRRNLRSGYEVATDPATVPALASDWTEAQWVKFLPDSARLQPADAAGTWKIRRTTGAGGASSDRLANWQQPGLGLPEKLSLDKARSHYLFCVTQHDLDAVGRPATQFHSIYWIDKNSGTLGRLATSLDAPLPLTATDVPPRPPGRFRGRIVEALAWDPNFEFHDPAARAGREGSRLG